MNLLLAIPLEVRLTVLFVVGALLAGQLNRGIYRLAWNPRLISPWSPPPPDAAPRSWFDRVAIFGWLALRREDGLHGRGFWIRPMLIEVACGAGLATLYWWEIAQLGLYPAWLRASLVVPPEILHLQFASHVVLLALMLVASMIDIDEQLIPDAITVTGTIAGLIAAAVVPWSLLPQLSILPVAPALGIAVQAAGGGPLVVPGQGQVYLSFLTLSSPSDWPARLGGAPRLAPLALGWGCFWLWCFAIVPRPWYGRHGWRRALGVATARTFRGLRHPRISGLLLAGSAVIATVWWIGGERWTGLLSALVGMAVSGGIVWAVRLIGAVTLRKEAMGFGDVMLMMMTGAFLGWQPCVVIFFLAPFAGLVIGLVQLALRREHVIPYGPFLCLAALLVIVAWAGIWEWARAIFGVGGLLPGVLLACLVAMGGMLLLWRIIREAIFGRE